MSVYFLQIQFNDLIEIDYENNRSTEINFYAGKRNPDNNLWYIKLYEEIERQIYIAGYKYVMSSEYIGKEINDEEAARYSILGPYNCRTFNEKLEEYFSKVKIKKNDIH